MIRVGFVGAGRLGRVHARHLMRLPGVSVGAFDVVPSSSESFASEVGGVAYGSFEELLEKSDAVAVVTPSDVHADFAVAALEAGKHVFIEKPVTLSVEAAGPISVAASARPELVCTVGQVLRWFPMYRRAHQLVKAGEIGVPAALRMSRGGGLPGGGRGWFEDHSKSGGVFIDLGVHDYDFLLWTFGPVVEVVARSVGAKTGSGADYGLATLTFESGAVGHVESTWMDAEDPGMSFEFCGSGGMLEWNSRTTGTVRGMGRVDGHFMPDDDPFFGQMKAFVDAIRGEASVTVSLADGVAALRVAEAALESARSGMRVKV
ncbi:MAG: Gfo/Idh/MocA family oxidoreductase [Armatimonadota bacterium]